MDFVRDRGWRFTGRPHIIGFGTKREVWFPKRLLFIINGSQYEKSK
jgi:hypothetical protein